MNMDFVTFDNFNSDDGSYSGISRLPDFRYEEIKGIVADIIERCQISSIPLDVFSLAGKLGISLVKFSCLTAHEMKQLGQWGVTEETDGFYALAKKNKEVVPYIYYNDRKEPCRVRFTLLHEIGHHVLGHKQQSDLAEAEANFFAKYLITPPMLVDMIKPYDYMDIAFIFNVSPTCAWNSFDYYEKWKRHHIRCGRQYVEYERRILKLCSVEIPKNYWRAV